MDTTTPEQRDALVANLWTDHDQFAADVAQLEGIQIGLALHGAQEDDPLVTRAAALLDIARAALADTQQSLALVHEAMSTQHADEALAALDV
jgi:hypothetical protein